MREAFREHHRLTKQELEQLWEDCIFALDTNVLLNIYRYADATRDDLFRVLTHLGDRVWVPYRVAEEFYANRVGVIKEQAARYEQLNKAVQNSVAQLNDGTFRKSGFLHVAELQEVLEPAVKKATQILDERRKAHPNLLHEDPYVERLVQLVGNLIGTEPTPDERQQAAADAQKRLDAKQPPGTGPDAQKEPPERYGDVFIWFELLALAQRKKRPIVWVTDEIKKDWWHVVEGERLGPRPELRLEMRKTAGVEFYIYSPARLLELVAAQPEIKVAPSSIDDAQKITEELVARSSVAHAPEAELLLRRSNRERSNFHEFVQNAEAAVKRWLTVNHPAASIERSRQRRVDFVVLEPDKKIAVDVIASRRSVSVVLANRLIEAGYQAHYLVTTGEYDDYLLVVVARNESDVDELSHHLYGHAAKPPFPNTLVGVIDEATQAFRPILRVGGSLLD